MAYGQKHLVKCRCVLPQFKQHNNPPAHQFIVFSIINDDDSVVIKYAQCTNCGVIHKVHELGKSEILQDKEVMSSIVTIDDIKGSLPTQLINILEASQCDLPTWEMVQFIYEHKHWGNIVVLASESDGDVKQGKFLKILGKRLFKVEAFTRNEVPNV